MKPIDVLFLCETNAATSLLAEAWLNHLDVISVRAFSAGRTPAAAMLEEAREALAAVAIPVDRLEPKSWSIFTLPGSRRPDVVVDLATLTWTTPGLASLSAHPVLRWPLRDPALIERPDERRDTTRAVFDSLRHRIDRDLVAALGRGGDRLRAAALASA